MSSVAELFRKTQHLPTIPKVAQELISTFNQPDVNIDDIAKKIALDQAISAKVLRLANTAAYGGSRKVASIRDAVMVLGFNSLRTLVLACSLVDSFRMPKGFDIKSFWGNSFRIAAICKSLARNSRQDAEIAFTCGLLHEIGDLLIMAEHPTQFVNIDNSVKLGGNRAEMEKTLLGFNYCEVGAELANRWHFPDTIAASIQHQSEPLAAPIFSANAALIFLAQIIVKQFNDGATPEQVMNALPEEMTHKLGLDTHKVSEGLGELAEISGDISAFL